jgi:hypothetical protein
VATPFGLFAQDKKTPQSSLPGISTSKAGKVPAKPTITTPIPGYQDYEAIGKQLEQRAQQAPELTKTGSYGKTTKGLPIRYIRVTNLLDATPKKKGKRSAISRQLSAMAGSAIVIAFQDGVEIFVFWLKADS